MLSNKALESVESKGEEVRRGDGGMLANLNRAAREFMVGGRQGARHGHPHSNLVASRDMTTVGNIRK